MEEFLSYLALAAALGASVLKNGKINFLLNFVTSCHPTAEVCAKFDVCNSAHLDFTGQSQCYNMKLPADILYSHKSIGLDV